MFCLLLLASSPTNSEAPSTSSAHTQKGKNAAKVARAKKATIATTASNSPDEKVREYRRKSKF